MTESKFKPEDKVRIVGYGSLHFVMKAGYKEMSQEFAKVQHELESQLLFGTKPTQEELGNIQGLDCPDHIISEDETLWICDLCPELVGQEGVVAGSYAHLYGASKDDDYHSYSVDGIAGKSAWYDEQQLELIQ